MNALVYVDFYVLSPREEEQIAHTGSGERPPFTLDNTSILQRLWNGLLLLCSPRGVR